MKESLEYLIDNYMFRYSLFGNQNNISNAAINNTTSQQNFMYQQNYLNNKYNNQLSQPFLY
jgi:hypothetical protein